MTTNRDTELAWMAGRLHEERRRMRGDPDEERRLIRADQERQELVRRRNEFDHRVRPAPQVAKEPEPVYVRIDWSLTGWDWFELAIIMLILGFFSLIGL
jgi:hypothetical protein